MQQTLACVALVWTSWRDECFSMYLLGNLVGGEVVRVRDISGLLESLGRGRG